jgi:hypothetical protein
MMLLFWPDEMTQGEETLKASFPNDRSFDFISLVGKRAFNFQQKGHQLLKEKI